MKILFAKSKWEAPHLSVDDYLARCRADGFEAAELCLKDVSESASEVAASLKNHGLALIAQVISEGATPEEHVASLEKQFAFARVCEPLFINMHTGRDYYSLADNVRIFEAASELSRRDGIPVYHETHRGRALFSTLSTVALLEALPELQLTADVSHWVCVHESDLSDQAETVARALSRAEHIHARVGNSEGPQVGHPLAPENRHWLEIHLALWRSILDRRRQAGAEFQTITPEFGPAPYMPVLPFTAQPIADAWQVNGEFMRWLRANL